MTIVKVWAVHWQRDRAGEIRARLYVQRSERFRWWWAALAFATFCSNWFTICTLHDESDQSNVVPMRRAG